MRIDLPRSVTCTALLLGLGGGAVGCADPISNEIFASDRVFLEALPSKERHAVDLEEDGGELPPLDSLPDDAPFLLAVTVGIAESSNQTVIELLEYVDAVRELPPTTREANHRSWGPYEHAPGSFIKVEMSREGRSHYDWSFSGSTSADDTFTPFFYGSHFAGDSVVEGDGAFVWDWDALADALALDTEGEMVVDYDHRVGKELLVEFETVRGEGEAASLDGSYWFWTDKIAGDFETRFPAEFQDDDDDPDTPSELELLQARTRWIVDGTGRSDATTWDGDWGEVVVDVSQCWSADFDTTYSFYDAGWPVDEGDLTLCPHPDFAEVERLPGEGPPD